MGKHTALGHLARLRIRYVKLYPFPADFKLLKITDRKTENRYLRIRIGHYGTEYTVTLEEKEGALYWVLRPYQNDRFITKAAVVDSFEAVIFAIREDRRLSSME